MTCVGQMTQIGLHIVNANVHVSLFVLHFYGYVVWMMIALTLPCGVSGDELFDQILGQVEGRKRRGRALGKLDLLACAKFFRASC